VLCHHGNFAVSQILLRVFGVLPLMICCLCTAYVTVCWLKSQSCAEELFEESCLCLLFLCPSCRWCQRHHVFVLSVHLYVHVYVHAWVCNKQRHSLTGLPSNSSRIWCDTDFKLGIIRSYSDHRLWHHFTLCIELRLVSDTDRHCGIASTHASRTLCGWKLEQPE